MTTEAASRIIQITVDKFRSIYAALGLHANKYLPSGASETKSALIMKAYQPKSEAIEERAKKLERRHLTPRESGRGVDVKGAAELVRKRREFGQAPLTIKLPKILLNADDFPVALADKDGETADDRKNLVGNAAIKVDLGPLYDWSKDKEKGEKDLADQVLDESEAKALDAILGDITESDLALDAPAPGTGPKLVVDPPAPAPAAEPPAAID